MTAATRFRRAPWAYRLMLRLLPGQLRRRHQFDMEDLFLLQLEEAHTRGGMATALAWFRAAGDAMGRAPYEHLRRFKRPDPRRWFSGGGADFRIAVRSWRQQPGATLLVLLTLTLAVGANVSVLSLVDALFFRPLPVPQQERVLYINERAPKWGLDFTGVNFPDFDKWRTNQRVFESMGLFDQVSVNLFDNGSAERITGAMVTHDLISALGFRPVLGRGFTAEEDRPKGPRVVMVGYGLWQSRFAGAPDVLGKTLRIDSEPYTIVGVLPREAEFPTGAQLWIPLAGDPAQPWQNYSYDGIARLKPGVTLEMARADLNHAHESIWAAGDTGHIISPLAIPLRERFVADFRGMRNALGLGVLIILIIACANVAGTMVARCTMRQREMAMRMALGAGSGRLARQMLTEALALASVAGILGTLLGWWITQVLVSSAGTRFPTWLTVGLDLRTVGIAVLLVGVTTLLFGLAPALAPRQLNLSSQLAGAGRSAGSRGQRRILDLLVIAENGLAAVLLIAGAMLLQAYGRVLHIDPGFRTEGVAMFRLQLPEAKYQDGPAQNRFFERLLREIQAIPGISGAGAVTCPPLSCHQGQFYQAEGVPLPSGNEKDPVILTRTATPGYFAAMGIQMAQGRAFQEGEGTAPGGTVPVVVNQSLAKLLWPGLSDVVGRRLRSRGDTTRPWYTVVGVAKDERHYGIDQAPRPGLYTYNAAVARFDARSSMAIVVSSARPVQALFPEIRQVLQRLDPELPMYQAQSIESAVSRALVIRRLITFGLGALSVIALTLAIGGIYAVLSYVVGRRRREIGIRMALGATRPMVLRMVMRQGGRLALSGLLLGFPLASGVGRVLQSQMEGAGGIDLPIYLLVAVLLAGTGLLAALVPARRAASVHPGVTLTDTA